MAWHIMKPRLLIDPGHGGKDSGAVGKISQEKDLNLMYALELYFLLHNDIEVYLTRKNDMFVHLSERVKMAKELNVNGFISIHCNSATFKDPTGTQVYYYNKQKDYPFAEMVYNFAIESNNIKSKWNGIRYGNYYVLRNMEETLAPSILVELGFISNIENEKMLNDLNYQRNLSSAIANGIKSFFL